LEVCRWLVLVLCKKDRDSYGSDFDNTASLFTEQWIHKKLNSIIIIIIFIIIIL
jgi:hypothetical protein